MTHTQKRRIFLRILACLLIFLGVISLKDLPVGLTAGCVTPQFGPNPPNTAVGVQPRSFVIGDFNNDGKKDLATANYGTEIGQPNGGISILLNNGSGGFFPAVNLSAGVNPRSIVTADFNGDSQLDLAILHYNSGSCCITGFITIFVGNGAGNFTAGSPIAVGSNSNVMTAGDFNKDGKADLVATLANSIAVFLGNGNAGFAAPTNFPVGGNLTSIASNDLDADGDLDIVVGNNSGHNVSVLLGNGSGAFGAATDYNTAGFVKFVVLGDFNGDAKLDVGAGTTGSSVAILLGTGSGAFGSPTQVFVTSSPNAVVAEDFTGDGKLDLVTPNQSNTVSILVGNGNGSFGPPTDYAVGGGLTFVRSTDFNGDGKSDLVVSNIASSEISILIGDGSGKFGGSRTFVLNSHSPMGLAVGDFNADGNPDVAIPNHFQSRVSVLLGIGGGEFGPEVKYPVASSPRDVVVDDFNGDAKLDLALATGSFAPENISVLLGTGTGTFAAATSFPGGANTWALTSGDFNNDGKRDLIVANNSGNNNSLSLLTGDGHGAFSPPVSIALGNSPHDVTTGDFNGDGNTDLAVASGFIFILTGNGAGGFSVGPPLDVASGVQYLAVEDTNADGRADLVIVGSLGALVVRLGDGSGGFGSPTTLPVTDAKDVASGDFNGDGTIDLAVPTGLGNVTVLTGDGTGAFGNAKRFNAGGGPGIVAADFNGDGKTDVANIGSAGFSVSLNSCPEPSVTLPSLTIDDVSIVERHGAQTNATFTVTLSASSTRTVAVSYYTISQTATSVQDYQPSSGQLTFAPGSTVQTFSVPVKHDTNVESDETFLVQLRDVLNAKVNDGAGQGTIKNEAVQLSSATYAVGEALGAVQVIITRTDTTAAATVDYSTSDTLTIDKTCVDTLGIASSRCDYATSIGTLRFAAGESSKTIFIPIVNDGYAEGNETFSITLSNAVGATLGSFSTASVTIQDNESVNGANPLDQVDFFIEQHYIDFLGRNPEPAGLAGWRNVLNNCGVTVAPPCDRIEVSAGFFRSPEFQARGYFIYRFYSSVGAIPLYEQFMPDFAKVSGFLSDAQLEANKVAFVNEFMARPVFQNKYSSTFSNPTAYVDALLLTVGLPSHPSRTTWITHLNTSNTTERRGEVLRGLVESQQVYDKYYNEAFVIMQYFGYLRRTADASYLDWINTMNQTGGDYRIMINGFMNSAEYRKRFGP